MKLYIDGVLIPDESIEDIKYSKAGVITVTQVYHDTKTKIITDSTVRKIKIKP